MKCPDCRFENLEDANFCSQCGTPLSKTPSGTFPAQSFDDKFAKIQRYLPQGLTKKILSQRDRIEGERRFVTVMFCDMEGFTPLVERLGAEEAYGVMDQVYEILIRQVHGYEGTINEMTGDGIMALFGAPIALEEAPQRALWAARAIHREMAVYNHKRQGQNPIRMRIGIHSGPVVVGTLGNDLRVEFKAVGDTVNLASRMERLAEPETTYVTQDVFKLTRGLFAFENLGKKVIKGWGENIPVYKVIPSDTDIHRPRLGTERMILSGMVGRASNLDKLELQVMRLINGEGSIVNIIGEAGIGKSRLVTELKQRESIQRVTVLEGRAISMGRNLSFHPIVDLIKQWAEIGTEDSEAVAFARLEAALYGVLQGKAVDVLPFIATLMGMKFPEKYSASMKGIEGEALEKLIRKRVGDLLSVASERRPLIVIIDDFHWADLSTIELMESLFRLSRRKRILFLNLFRPGYVATGERIVSAIKEKFSSLYIEIPLEPLDDQMSEALIVDMLNLRGVNHAVIDKIVQRAGGNPFFIEEVVRSFIDEGAIVLKDGTFKVTAKFGTMSIPNTINDVLMARIDSLEEDARDLLKVAAVIGRTFFYRILAKVAGSVQNVDDRLSYLKATELILERERFEELEYQFKHALTQETAYASILPQKCKALHLKVADTIEKVFAKKMHAFYGMLAYHYSRAESLDKAEEALIKAGEEALKSSASSEALHYYMEAMRLYRQKSGEMLDPAKIALLEKNIALAFFNHGQYEEAIEYFDKALSYYWGNLPTNAFSLAYRLSAAFMHFLVALYLPFIKYRQKTSPEDIQTIDLFHKKSKALGIINPMRFFIESVFICREVTCKNLSDAELWLEIFVESSCLFSFTGISFKLSEKILAASKKIIEPNKVKVCLIYDFMKTIHQYLIGNWGQIDSHDLGLVNKNLEMGEVFIASQHLYWHGCPNIYMGKLAAAEDVLKELSNIAEVYENDFSILLKYMLKIKLLIEQRLLDEALDEIGNGIAFAKKKKFLITLVDFHSCQAKIFTLRKEFDGAADSLQKADEIRSTTRATPIQLSIYFRSEVEYLISRLEDALKNEHTAALKYRKKAAWACRRLIKSTRKAAQHRTEAYRLRGIYCGLLNKPDRAFKWLAKSIAVGEKLGARPELARTYVEMGKRMRGASGGSFERKGLTAEDYFGKARTLFAEMGLQWDLDKLEHLTRN